MDEDSKPLLGSVRAGEYYTDSLDPKQRRYCVWVCVFPPKTVMIVFSSHSLTLTVKLNNFAAGFISKSSITRRFGRTYRHSQESLSLFMG